MLEIGFVILKCSEGACPQTLLENVDYWPLVDTVGNSIQTLVLMCKCAVIVIHACVVNIDNN